MRAQITTISISTLVLFSFYQVNTLQESVERGKSVYEANCMSCHMVDGQGLDGAFPPLAKTGRLSDKKRLVKIIYNGMSGPITVNGKEYDMEMNPVILTEKETTDVLNYIRNSWGNKNPEIKTSEVASLRAAGQ